MFGETLVIRCNRAGVAEGTEVLAGIKAERSSASELSGPHAVGNGTVRLARVFDDLHRVGARHLFEPAHAGKMTVEMDRTYGGRARADGGFDTGRIDRRVAFEHVDDDRGSRVVRSRARRAACVDGSPRRGPRPS